MKKKSAIAFLLALVMLLSLCACGKSESPNETADPQAAESKAEQAAEQEKTDTEYEITDMLGRKVTVPSDASSYACIGPGALRLYCYVADDNELVGVESIEQKADKEGRPYTMSIPNVKELNVIGAGGPGNVPDAELLFMADPDVIFTCYSSDVSGIEELQEKTGIPVVTLSYGKSVLFDEAVYDSLRLVGQITGHSERAEEFVKFFEDTKADLSERVSGITDRPSVYLGCQSSRGSHGIESTSGDYALFEILNAVNVVKEAGINEYVMLDKEKILEMNPDVIIIDAGGLSLMLEDYETNPEFYKALDAFKNGSVYVQMPYNWYTTNIEIALADAYYIGSVLYPDEFADIDPAAKFDEITNFFLGIDCYEKISEVYGGGFRQIKLWE